MRFFHSWLNPKLEVRTDKSGQAGIFARESLWKGEKLAVFGGHVMLISEAPPMGTGGDYALQIDEQFVLGTRHGHEIEDTDFFNHSCSPNAGFDSTITLVAMRAIAQDEQITFDYAMCLHASRWRQTPYRMQCQCGAQRCRGFVTEDDWRNPELQHRYKGFFSGYLQKKIEKKG